MKLSFLPVLQMSSYAAQYGCTNDAVHTCHDCPEGRVREFGRVRRAGFIKISFLDTLLANPIDPTIWQAGIIAGAIIVLPETSGTYDGGAPKELKGFGERRVSYGPRTMKMAINDPDYADNYHFYNEISQRTDLVPFFGTSSMIRIFDEPANITAKDPVADDLEEEVIWNVDIEVISVNLPIMVPKATIDSVFACSNF